MKKMLFASAALACILAAAPANAAIVTNGSFELGTNPGAFTTVNAINGSAITGWTVSGGSVDYIGTYWNASNGVRSIDLSGNNPGTISQTLTGLHNNGRYLLTFDLAGNTDGAPTIKTVNVSAGTGSQSFTFDTSGHNRSSLGWTTQTLSFFATGTTATLTFASPLNESPGFYGPALDNVQVSAVPEPSTWAMMLVGFMGLAFLSRRKVQKLAA